MKPRFASIALITLLASAPAHAALAVGAPAPDFTAQAAQGGKEFTFTLSEALKKGPVVLYFYPKSFTQGCTVEAHDFAEATDGFAALGATVIGVSHDAIDTQKKFSVAECRNKFAVAADPDGKVIDQFKVRLNLVLPISDRTSYVIAPDSKVSSGKVIFAFTDMNPDQHVTLTMGAVKKWKEGGK